MWLYSPFAASPVTIGYRAVLPRADQMQPVILPRPGGSGHAYALVQEDGVLLAGGPAGASALAVPGSQGTQTRANAIAQG